MSEAKFTQTQFADSMRYSIMDDCKPLLAEQWNRRASSSTVQQVGAESEALAALRQMHRFFQKWPEFVPSPTYMEEACRAIEMMNAAIASSPKSSQGDQQ